MTKTGTVVTTELPTSEIEGLRAELDAAKQKAEKEKERADSAVNFSRQQDQALGAIQGELNAGWIALGEAQSPTTDHIYDSIRQLAEDRDAAKRALAEVQEELNDAVLVLQFYANPETYFAISHLPDPPCGEFMEDFSLTPDLGMKPGKRARNLFEKYAALAAKSTEQGGP